MLNNDALVLKSSFLFVSLPVAPCHPLYLKRSVPASVRFRLSSTVPLIKISLEIKANR